MTKKECGYYDYCTDANNTCTVTSWNDNRIVLLVSTCDSTFPVRQTNRWVSKENKKVAVSQSNVALQYNRFMGGVHRMDENIANYRVAIRSKKWWWPLFAFGIDMTVHNACKFTGHATVTNTIYLHSGGELSRFILRNIVHLFQMVADLLQGKN